MVVLVPYNPRTRPDMRTRRPVRSAATSAKAKITAQLSTKSGPKAKMVVKKATQGKRKESSAERKAKKVAEVMKDDQSAADDCEKYNTDQVNAHYRELGYFKAPRIASAFDMMPERMYQCKIDAACSVIKENNMGEDLEVRREHFRSWKVSVVRRGEPLVGSSGLKAIRVGTLRWEAA